MIPVLTSIPSCPTAKCGDGRVYCEKHGSSFDCRSGEVRGLPATEDVQSFAVEQRGDEVWVELPDYA